LLGLYNALTAAVKTLDDGIALVVPSSPIQGTGNPSGLRVRKRRR